MRIGFFGIVMVGGAVGCGDPFPEIETQTAPLDDTSPAATGERPTTDPSPTGETGEPTTPTTTEPPRPDDVTFRIQLERLELLTQNCDGGTNGPAAEVWYQLRVLDTFGVQQEVERLRPNSIDMLPTGDPDAVPLELEADPVEIRINEDETDQLEISGQVYDKDLTSDDLIGNFDDLRWTDPDEVPTGTIAFTREGPSENSVDSRCEVSLFVTIEQIDPLPDDAR